MGYVLLDLKKEKKKKKNDTLNSILKQVKEVNKKIIILNPQGWTL